MAEGHSTWACTWHVAGFICLSLAYSSKCSRWEFGCLCGLPCGDPPWHSKTGWWFGFVFPIQLGIIIPIDSYFSGVLKPPTRKEIQEKQFNSPPTKAENTHHQCGDSFLPIDCGMSKSCSWTGSRSHKVRARCHKIPRAKWLQGFTAPDIRTGHSTCSKVCCTNVN